MTGEIAWYLASAALVLLMVPGLALFYGGMVRSKNMLNMLNMNLYCLGIIPIVWAVIGFSIANGGGADDPHGWFGFLNLGNFWMNGVTDAAVDGGEAAPGTMAYWAYAATFAVITPALISGAVADRIKFSAWAIFVPVWSVLVYSPVFFWVYGGWIINLPAHDTAGGTAIHINAGAAALAMVLVLGKRAGWPKSGWPPHNLPFVVLGTGILFFGWFGFNSGGYPAESGQALTNTFLAGAAGMIAWMLVEVAKLGKPTTLGMCSGVVAGLVAITPAASFVGTMSSMVFGLAAGVICFFAITLKEKLGYDDSLDVVGIHMVGGIIGGLLVGIFASFEPFVGLLDEPFLEGGVELFFNQVISIVVVMVFSFVMTFIIAKALDATIGLRVSTEAEDVGLDTSEHAETAYQLGAGIMGRVQ